MAEGTEVHTEVTVTEAVEKADYSVGDTEATTVQVVKEKNKFEEENALDGEFIKVEKEGIDAKDGLLKNASELAKDKEPTIIERSSSHTKELEQEVEKLTGVLKSHEHENSQLKDEISLTKDKLEKSEAKYGELELNCRKLKEQIVEKKNEYSVQLKSLKDALEAQEKKQKEMIEMKQALDGVSFDLESSRKRMQELEHELKQSASEAKKFEELHQQSGLHAESETKKAMEFESLLEAAKQPAKEAEDQMGSLQGEIQRLNVKITENQKVEVALKTVTAELAAVQEELTLSKSQLLDWEKKMALKETVINELTDQLNLRITSENQLKEELSELQSLCIITKDELKAKVSELEAVNSTLEIELNLRESLETAVKTQKAQVASVKEDLLRINEEKCVFEKQVDDLTASIKDLKELTRNLEEKLKISDDKFSEADSILSKALSDNAELEKKLKSLEELHTESEAAAMTASQKNLELQDLVQAAKAATGEVKSQLTELEARYLAAEQKNVELEQQLNLVELKNSDAGTELKELSEKISDLNGKLRDAEEDKNIVNEKLQEYTEKLHQLESALNASSSRNKELEEELKMVTGKCTEHEDRANMSHNRSIELEDLFQSSHSKLGDADKKVSELELLLEAEKYRIQELEQQISALENKCNHADADSNKHLTKLFDLTSELEAFQARTSSLEAVLQAANERETQLTESLTVATDEKNTFENASNNLSQKLAEAENLIDILRSELSLTQEKLQDFEKNLKITESREGEVLEKLKFSEEKINEQEREIDQFKARILEIEQLLQSLTRESEVKLQEARSHFSSKDMEIESLTEKLKAVEGQIVEADTKSALKKEELDEISRTLSMLEITNNDLRVQLSELENKSSQAYNENEMLVETNNQLKRKVDELEELLKSVHTEREATAQQLVSHERTISEMIDQHSRTIEVHLASNSRITELESQLKESIERNMEAKELQEKLMQSESQVRSHERQAEEAQAIADIRKVELEECFLKLRQVETTCEDLQAKSASFEKEIGDLTSGNLKLSEEIAIYKSKVSELQLNLSAGLAEKDEIAQQLLDLQKALQDVRTRQTSEGQELQSQLTSITEEKNILQSTIKELEEQLIKAELIRKEEKKEREFQKLEQEAALKKSQDELEARGKAVSFLKKQIAELEETLKQKQAKISDMGVVGKAIEQNDGTEIKSRDIGSSISTPSKRKSKKKSEVTEVPASSSLETPPPTGHVSAALNLKFVLGVALVSVIIGIVLGKSY